MSRSRLQTMTTAAQTPMAEYLETSYRPDCEFVDGEIRQRNVGEWEHARMLSLLAGWCGKNEARWNILGASGVRLRVSASRVRIPDLVLLRSGPQPDVLFEAPLLIIEILSPDDTYTDLQERCRDYNNLGVKTVWIVDPKTRSGRMCLGAEWKETARLEVPGTPIFVELADLFLRLDGQA